MSRLAEVIRRAMRPQGAPLGFGLATAQKPDPPLLLLVRLSQGDTARAAEAAAAGASAVIIDGARPEALRSRRELEGVLWGARPAREEREDIASLQEAGADFAVLSPRTPAEALLLERMGLVLALEDQSSDSELQVVRSLPLDALLLPPLEEPFTLERLLQLRRISFLSRMPLLMPLAADTSVPRLQALREAGVAGVIISGGEIGHLPALREAVQALPLRSRRQEERSEAILPATSAAPSVQEEEEEEWLP